MWRAACGRIDLDVMGRAFWAGQFGVNLTAADLTALHPLRSLELPPAEGEKPAPEVLNAKLDALFMG